MMYLTYVSPNSNFMPTLDCTPAQSQEIPKPFYIQKESTRTPNWTGRTTSSIVHLIFRYSWFIQCCLLRVVVGCAVSETAVAISILAGSHSASGDSLVKSASIDERNSRVSLTSSLVGLSMTLAAVGFSLSLLIKSWWSDPQSASCSVWAFVIDDLHRNRTMMLSIWLRVSPPGDIQRYNLRGSASHFLK